MEAPYHQPRVRGSSNPVNHSRRSWTDNGVHYQTDNYTYSSPGLSFHAVSGGANGLGLFDNFNSPGVSRRQTAPSLGSLGTGIFGTALGLLGDLASNHHHANQLRGSRQRRGGMAEVEEASDEDDEITYIGSRPNRPKSMFGRFVDKIAEKGSPKRQQSTRQSPPRRPRPVERQDRSYRTETREPLYQGTRGSFIEVIENDDFSYTEHDRRGQRPPQPRRSSSGESNASIIAALDNAVQHHATEVRRCKKQLERASRQQQVHSGHLQALLDELKTNEAALSDAVHKLHAAKEHVAYSEPQRQPSGHGRPSRSRHQSREAVVDDEGPTLPGPGFTSFGRQRQMHPLFGEFGFNDMDPLADHMFAHHFATFGGVGMPDPFAEFFGVPQAVPQGGASSSQRKRTRTAPSSGGGSQTRRPASFAHTRAPPPPRPPPTLLTPDECKRLYKMYSEQWAALPNTDPNIPFPARGLHATSLLGRDTLWAPQVTAHPSTWSDETVMQANVQAFFLNVVGLIPKYTEAAASGRVEMGFDRSRATPEQVKRLQDILKKERMKWHSDRLGNRNRGMPGRNEGLQQDERARAVFHAVCELIESAQ